MATNVHYTLFAIQPYMATFKVSLLCHRRCFVVNSWYESSCFLSTYREQEELTRQAEEKAESTQKELEEAKATIAELEAELQIAKAAAEQRGKNSGKSSRSSGKGMGPKRNSKLSLQGQAPTRPNNKRS